MQHSDDLGERQGARAGPLVAVERKLQRRQGGARSWRGQKNRASLSDAGRSDFFVGRCRGQSRAGDETVEQPPADLRNREPGGLLGTGRVLALVHADIRLQPFSMARLEHQTPGAADALEALTPLAADFFQRRTGLVDTRHRSRVAEGRHFAAPSRKRVQARICAIGNQPRVHESREVVHRDRRDISLRERSA